MEMDYDKSNVKEIKLGKDEAVLYENENIIIKRDDEDETLIGIGYLVISSKKISFYPSNYDNEINFFYQDISYHALSKENGCIILQLNLNECSIKKYEQIIKFELYEKLLIYPSDPQDLTLIFDQISVGSSLNPEFQETNNNINVDFSQMKISEIKDKYDEEFEEEEEVENEDYEMEQVIENNEDEKEDKIASDDKVKLFDMSNFDEYKCINTIDKMKKVKLLEDDEKRFEDADI